MWWIEDTDAVPVMPAITQAKTTEKHFFSDGDPQMRRNATVVTEEFMNIIQCELMNLIEGVGMELKKTTCPRCSKPSEALQPEGAAFLFGTQ